MNVLKAEIERVKAIIKVNEEKIKYFESDPDALSDEPTMGGLVRASSLIERHKKAIKEWKKELKRLEKRQFELELEKKKMGSILEKIEYHTEMANRMKKKGISQMYDYHLKRVALLKTMLENQDANK